MNYSFKQIIEFLGIGAVVVSLLFVGYELRQARAIAQTEFRFQTVEQTRSLREYITENAEIWAKGCMNEDLSIEESVIFYNIAKSAMDHQFYRWANSVTGIVPGPVGNGVNVVARNIFSFPGYNEVWELDTTGSPEFKQAVSMRFNSLVQSGAERINDVSLCGA